MVCRYLQWFRRILEAMDFIQHDRSVPQAVKEALWLLDHAAHPRQLTVEVLCMGQALAEAGLTDAPHAGQPNHGALPPCALKEVLPESPLYHKQVWLHIVTLYATILAFRSG